MYPKHVSIVHLMLKNVFSEDYIFLFVSHGNVIVCKQFIWTDLSDLITLLYGCSTAVKEVQYIPMGGIH